MVADMMSDSFSPGNEHIRQNWPPYKTPKQVGASCLQLWHQKKACKEPCQVWVRDQVSQGAASRGLPGPPNAITSIKGHVAVLGGSWGVTDGSWVVSEGPQEPNMDYIGGRGSSCGKIIQCSLFQSYQSQYHNCFYTINST